MKQKSKLSEREKRDRILDALQIRRRYLINMAKHIAENMARKNGTVTSPEVLKELIFLIGEEALDKIDRRFMGCVFRGREWVRVGFDASGSHAQVISVWKKAE